MFYLILGHGSCLINEVAVQLTGNCLEFLCIILGSSWLGDILLLGGGIHADHLLLLGGILNLDGPLGVERGLSNRRNHGSRHNLSRCFLGGVGQARRLPLSLILVLLHIFFIRLDIFIKNWRDVSRAPDPQHNIVLFLLLNLNMFKF